MADFLAGLLTWQGQQAGIVAYLALILGNTLLNTLTLRRLEDAPEPSVWPAVAVLVPARNEEETIERCVCTLLAQMYPHFSVWVLDDASTDRTPDILARLAAEDSRLHLLRGAPLPDGWLGKPWACQQLAQAVDADLLLFVDADTEHHPHLVRDAVAALIAGQADLLSAIPHELTPTLAEKLTVPIIPWSLLTHFPLTLARWLGWPVFAAAIGQMMLFRREAYQAVGGHAAVRREVAEDMALARLVARRKLRWRLLDGTGRIACRMYRSPGAVWEGFGKNLFPVFGRNLLLFLFVWLWLGVVFLGPWVGLVSRMIFGASLSLAAGLVAILLALLVWAVTVVRLRLARDIILLYPWVHLVAVLLAFHSLGQSLTGRATWKQRRVG